MKHLILGFGLFFDILCECVFRDFSLEEVFEFRKQRTSNATTENNICTVDWSGQKVSINVIKNNMDRFLGEQKGANKTQKGNQQPALVIQEYEILSVFVYLCLAFRLFFKKIII